MQVSQANIKSETSEDKVYTIYFISNINSDYPYEIVCNCDGYKNKGTCKHIEKYDPSVSELYKTSSNYCYETSNHIKITTKEIQSETNKEVSYILQYLFWNNEEIPREMICSCKGYFYRRYCKHLNKYNPYNKLKMT